MRKRIEMLAREKKLCHIIGVATRQKRYKLHTNLSVFFRANALKKSAKTSVFYPQSGRY
jgi:hypothetical protein